MPTFTNKQKATEASYKRWENERGLQIVVYLKPLKSNVKATGLFRGNEYVASGNSNSEALDNIMKILKEVI